MLPTSFFGFLVAFSSLAAGQTLADLDAIKKATALYPPCAITCLTQLVPQSDCSLTDTECLCKNEELTKATEACVLKGCSNFDGLQTKNASMTMCNQPIRDKHLQPMIISLTGGTLALLAFLMRLSALFWRKTGRSVGADDYMCGAALLLAAPPTLTTWSFRDNGLGKDIWTLDLDQIKNVLKLYYLGSIFYIASITMVKISLVCFILRVFPDERFRRICYGTMALVAAYGISFVVATSLQCWPAEYAWERIDSDAEGTCNNVHLQAWMAAIFNIVLDLLLLLLPLKSLWGLQMNLKKKLMIMSMFSLGLFVTIISTIRLHTLIKFANSTNISWDYVEAGYWSLVEMHASIICACLPYCRHLLISFGATFLKSTNKDPNSRAYGSRSRPTMSRKGSDGAILSSGKTGNGQPAPKHGDEGDFVPLVEYPNRNWDKQTTVSATNTYASTDST